MKKLLAIITIPIFAAGCASNSTRDAILEQAQEMHEKRAEEVKTVVSSAPDWYFNPPTDERGLIGVGYAKSPDPQFAMEQARLIASSQIAETYNPQVSVLKKSFKSQTQGSNPVVSGNTTSAVDLFVNETDLSGAQVIDSEYFVENGYVHMYVQMFLPFDDSNYIKMQRTAAAIEKSTQSSADKAHSELRARVKEQKDQPGSDMSLSRASANSDPVDLTPSN